MAIATIETGAALTPEQLAAKKSAQMAQQETAAPIAGGSQPAAFVDPWTGFVATSNYGNTYAAQPLTPTGDKSAIMAQQAGSGATIAPYNPQANNLNPTEAYLQTNTTPPSAQTAAQQDPVMQQQQAQQAATDLKNQQQTAEAYKQGYASGVPKPSADRVPTKLPDLPKEATAEEITAALDQFKSKMPNEYLTQLQDMKYEYDVSTDNQYRLAASQLEQQVTNMMVGRGGLYSSVYASALQSGLMELQVKYEQIAYDKFVTERNWVMNMAKFISDRQDTEFSQNLATANFMQAKQESAFNQQLSMAKFRLDQEQTAFSQRMALRDQQLQEARAVETQAKAEAQGQQQNMLVALQTEYTQLTTAQKQYKRLYDRWASLGHADGEISAFFHVQPGTNPQTGVTAIRAKYQTIQAAEQTYLQHVAIYNNGEQAAKAA